MTALSEGDWRRAVDLLARARSVVLACHVAPDGDALGSMLALGLGLRARGVDVVAAWGEDPQVVPDAYSFLPGLELLTPVGQVPPVPELLVTLDTSSPDRLGALADRLDTAGCVVVLDHHTSGQPFGDVRLVDDGSAATVVLVAELLDRLGCPLDQQLATCLYTGLVTDTGSFKYAATTPAVHALAGRLLATGIRHDLITRAVYDTNPYGYLQVLGRACADARLEQDAVRGLGLVWTSLPAALLADAAVTLADVEGVIDVVRTAREAEVAVVLKQEPDGPLRVSTRSKGSVDLGAVCGALGGGGHRFAAGFTSYEDVETTMQVLRAALDDAPHLPA